MCVWEADDDTFNKNKQNGSKLKNRNTNWKLKEQINQSVQCQAKFALVEGIGDKIETL